MVAYICLQCCYDVQFLAWMAVWFNGNTLVVTLHRAWLVSGWVTAFGWVNYLGMQPAT